ncbi:MAG: MmcQ/YjbR family DNA-binding protein [Myxococcaceae bacterium]|nr:MmcQ/YjbR family DNA-binding protein [Myxococcaceae bacterium]
MPSAQQLLHKLRKIACALPGVEEQPWYAHAVFKVRNKTFLNFMNDHHGDGRIAIWAKAAPGVQAELVALDPDVFFVPPYMGPSGWIGVRLDRKRTDWGQVKQLVTDAWQLQAPKRLKTASPERPQRRAGAKPRATRR